MVVTWNSAAVLGGCLDALAERGGGIEEVVVVDNGSTDETLSIARAHRIGARVVANERDRGLAAANNQGLAATSAPYVLIANPDTEVGEGAVDALADLLDRRPRAIFAIPRLHRPDGSPQASAGGLPGFTDAYFGRQVNSALGRDGEGFWWDGWAHDEERRIDRGHEACYLIRRGAADDVGPQDEAFRLDWEGVDWTARAAERGWEVWFTPAAEVLHVGGASVRQVPLRWIAGSHLGMYRYFAKRTSPLLRPFLALLVAVRAALKVPAAALGAASYERSNLR